MIMEFANPGSTSENPEGYVVVAQSGVITVKIVDGGKVKPFREEAPEGNFDDAVAEVINFLTGQGYRLVDA